MPSTSGVASVKIGSLDRRIAILRNGPATDDGYTIVPGELGILAQRSARWQPASRLEQFESMGKEAKSGGSFVIRSDSVTRQIIETDKLAWDGALYEIQGIRILGRRDAIELFVEAPDGQTEIDLSGLSPIPDATVTYTGWASYVHTGATQVVLADTETTLLNNAGVSNTSQMPADVGTLYDGQYITGRNGDSISAGIEFTFTPSSGDATGLVIGIDIGGAVGKLYTEDFPLIKGMHEPHKVSYHPPAYTLDTWEANGAAVKIIADGHGTITDVRYVIHRLHKAR